MSAIATAGLGVRQIALVISRLLGDVSQTLTAACRTIATRGRENAKAAVRPQF